MYIYLSSKYLFYNVEPVEKIYSYIPSHSVTYLIVLGTFGIESLEIPCENILVVFPRKGKSKSASISTRCEKVLVSCPLIEHYFQRQTTPKCTTKSLSDNVITVY